jgi:membrane protease YdiL (CAAX protease family)
MEPRLDIASLIFLVVLFVLTPRAALRSARVMRQAREAGVPIPRLRIMLSTAFALTVTWLLAQLNATAMKMNLFAMPPIGTREVLIGLGGFAGLLALIPISNAIRTPEEERKHITYSLAPRNTQEVAAFAVIAVMAGIAEESAYRGVAVWLLAPILGSLYPAAFLSAMAFGVAHAVQGAKSMIITFVVALLFQTIVQLTGTLVIAMVVHAAYDIVAGLMLKRRIERWEAAPGAA